MSCSPDYTTTIGDTGNSLQATISDESGPLDLTGTTVELNMTNRVTGDTVGPITMTIDDASAGEVSHTWAPYPAAGDYDARYTVVAAQPLFAPSSGFLLYRFEE